MNLGVIAKYAVEVGNKLRDVVKALIGLRKVDSQLGDETASEYEHHWPGLKFNIIVRELSEISRTFTRLEEKPKVVASEPQVVNLEPDVVGCLCRHRNYQRTVDRHYALTLLGIANKIINEHKLNSVRLISRGL